MSKQQTAETPKRVRKTPFARAQELRTQAEWLSATAEIERLRGHIKAKNTFDALNQARELVERLETLHGWAEEDEGGAQPQEEGT